MSGIEPATIFSPGFRLRRSAIPSGNTGVSQSFSNTKSILEDIGNIGIQINYLYFSVQNIEELDCLTKPEHFSKGLWNLGICLKDTIPLSDTFFDNINRIKLKEISFEFDDEVTGSFDIIRILKKFFSKYRTKFELWAYHK